MSYSFVTCMYMENTEKNTGTQSLIIAVLPFKGDNSFTKPQYMYFNIWFTFLAFPRTDCNISAPLV